MCEVRAVDQKCVRKQCLFPTQEICEKNAGCAWGPQTVSVNGVATQVMICTPMKYDDIMGAAQNAACQEVTKDRSLLMYLLIGIAAALLLGLVWIWWRQRNALQVQQSERVKFDGGDEMGETMYESPKVNDLERPINAETRGSVLSEEEQLDAL